MRIFVGQKSTTGGGATRTAWQDMTPRQQYLLRRAYYDNTDLYIRVKTAMEADQHKPNAILPLRNFVPLAVDTHVDLIWQGSILEAHPIIWDEKQKAESRDAAIKKIDRWSNWRGIRSLAIRQLARDGDLFLKAVAVKSEGDTKGRVYRQLLDPYDVVDFTKDDRGYLIMIRIETTLEEQGHWRVEYWNLMDDEFKVWEGEAIDGIEVNDLPDDLRIENDKISERFKIDFLPFVHIPFIDTGRKDKRGIAVADKAVDATDEMCRMATRNHQMATLHNTAAWFIETQAKDAQGRPLAHGGKLDRDSKGQIKGETVLMGDELVTSVQPGFTMTPKVPQLQYAAVGGLVNDQQRAAESVLPELAYHHIKQAGGDLSGTAIRLRLGDLISRIQEARNNADYGKSMIDIMLLTLGQILSIDGFSIEDIGSYEDGDFEHEIGERDVIPVSGTERATEYATLIQGGMPMVTAMGIAGYSPAEIEEAKAERVLETSTRTAALAQQTINAATQLQTQRAIIAGENGNAPTTEADSAIEDVQTA